MAEKTMSGVVAKFEDDREPTGTIKGTISIEELKKQDTDGYALVVGGSSDSKFSISGISDRDPDTMSSGNPKFDLTKTDFVTIYNNCVQNDDNIYVAEFEVTKVDDSTGQLWLYAGSASGEYLWATFA